MANEEHLAILKKGVKEWNAWREENPGVRPDLTESSLQGANLSGANLQGANLFAADLSGANLSFASLGRSRLVLAKLIRANLRWASFGGTNLRGADLSHASLHDAGLTESDLSMAILRATDFTDCKMEYATIGDVDLSSAKGLDAVRHLAPSTVGIDTIYKSNGKIPEVFLRGAGVPEPFIVQVKALVGAMEPIQFYSCFISYSTKDEEFAQSLYADLQSKHVRCWFAPHDVRGGKKLHEQIDEAIRVHEKVLLILSAESMTSEWVKTEIAKARKREVREKKQVLFPVRLVSFEAIRDWECFDADAGKDSAREIREYFIPDFSQWKDHDKYKEGFERLLKDLKSSGE